MALWPHPKLVDPNSLGNLVDTFRSSNRHSTDSSRSSAALWLARIRTTEGCDVAVRAFGSAWFLFLAIALACRVFELTARINAADIDPAVWPTLLSSVCLFLFYLTLWWLMLIRPTPTARTDGVLPSLVAFAGGYLPWAIPLLAPGGASASQSLLSALLVVTGTTLMVVAIFHLGRSFSIVPQARSLVQTGPYAIVRNPLYLAEEIAILGALLQFYSTVTLLLLLAHFVLQVRRIFYEESLLRHAFADYENYAKTTFRLVPYVW
jgi:protein-S-isoprenylcysteine O-methyltransferase Ste14